MTIFPMIVDTQPAYAGCTSDRGSLLLMPLGAGTLLSYVCDGLGSAGEQRLRILTGFEPIPEYEQAVRDVHADVDAVVRAVDFASTLETLEPSDWLLIVDPRCLPLERNTVAELARANGSPSSARHLVALENGSQGTTECVQVDAGGRVYRIQRYYDGITWLNTCGVACSLVSAASINGAGVRGFSSLPNLRRELATRGMPSRDVTLTGEALDLTDERGFMSLSERVVHEVTSRRPPAGYRLTAPGVVVAGNCRIHPSARIYGPIVVQENVTIEQDAVIIGPTVLGAGSVIGRGAVVAQSVVARRAALPPGHAARQRVVCGGETSAEVERSAAASRRSGRAVRRVVGAPAVNASVERRGRLYPQVKCVLEALVAIAGLLALSPLLLIVAALIKLESRGPVLFSHTREGKDGRQFRCWKYRTMVQGAHAQQRSLYSESAVDGPQFKLSDDRRITPLGHYLRVSNIDELPQLINVALGQMSLIGPRPSPFRENQICVPWRQARLSVRPGITGLWQICRHERWAGDFHQWIHYDMLYVRHCSAWLDLKILGATLLTAGGRWSMPITWLIPHRALVEDVPAETTPAVRSILWHPAIANSETEVRVPRSA